MPKQKISEFSSTPANNTDIDSINIAEGCAPSGINDAIRELMAQLKDWQSGTSNDPYVVGSSGSLTLNQGTANGVAYLNGSKVVTSGSALTFDGTKLTSSASGAISGVFNRNTSSGATLDIQVVGGSVGTLGSDSGGNGRFDIAAGTSLQLRATGASGFISFDANNTEGMRLTSTGLGIGTSSPSVKLDVAGAIRSIVSGGTPAVYLNNGSTQHSIQNESNAFTFYNSGVKQMTLDSSGNLGLGVTPSAWGSQVKALQSNNGVYFGAFQGGATPNLYLGTNNYFNGTNWIYSGSYQATKYEQLEGKHSWFNAPSGTAGNTITFTQAMTLDASGNLGIGATANLTAKLNFPSADSGEVINIYSNSVAAGRSGIGKYSGETRYYCGSGDIFTWVNGGPSGTERARIDSSGNLLVGTTTQINSAKSTISYAGSANNGLAFIDTVDQSNTEFLSFHNSAGTKIGGVNRVTTTNAVVYATTSDYRQKTVTGAVSGQGSRIDALKPIDYLWTDGNQQARGFLAHEFQIIYPNSVSGEKDAVDTNGNPKYQSMQSATSEVIADLVAEIQSLRKRLADAGI